MHRYYKITKRMCYLYDMDIAHCDLMPRNILVDMYNQIIDRSIQYAIVKMIEFGWIKIEVGRTSKATKNNQICDTLNYMAQVVMKNEFQTIIMCHFKADDYLFTMICSKILSRIQAIW